MKWLLCKLGFHSWTHWHKMHASVTPLACCGARIVETRRCYGCGREEFHEFV